jgi:diaminopimelate epimerase
MNFDTVAGPLAAVVQGDQVTLRMTEPRDVRPGRPLSVAGRTLTVHFLNTGVPHAVVECDPLADWDVPTYGAALRHHDAFAPAGTNANFVTLAADRTVRVRTYERGVEAETLACGTGIVAAALVLAGLHHLSSPVQVVPTGGDRLVVGFERKGAEFRNVTLAGPAVHVFKGVLVYG